MSSSSETTQVTKLPEPSPEEKAIMGMISGALMPTYLEESGYDVTKTEEKYEDSPEYKSFQTRRSRIEENKGLKQSQLDDLLSGNATNIRGHDQYTRNQSLQGQINAVRQEIGRLNNELSAIDKEEQKFISTYKPQVSYETRKMDSPEVEYIRTKYGAESQEYKTAKEAYDQEKIDTDKSERALQSTFREKAQKFLNGDFSITNDQRNLIRETMAPVRAAVNQMFDENEAITQRTFNEFENRIRDTGLSITQALDVVGDQIIKTGSDMESALSNTISVNKELLKMGIEDYTGQITKKVASIAAATGRSPDDPEYQSEIQNQVARQVKEGQLSLSAMESQGLIGIKERTGAQMESLLLQKAGVAERTGTQLEQATMARGSQEMQNAGQRGSANIGIEESIANQAWQIGAGMPPQQIGVATGVSQYNQALSQQRIQNASAAMNAPMPLISYYQGERMAQPTVNSRTVDRDPFGQAMSAFTGIMQAGSNIYGAAASSGGAAAMMCLPKGTLIELEDGQVEQVQALSVGDIVKGGKVIAISSRLRDLKHKFSKHLFKSGKSIIMTYGHPFFNEELSSLDIVESDSIATFDILTDSGFYYSAGVKLGSTINS